MGPFAFALISTASLASLLHFYILPETGVYEHRSPAAELSPSIPILSGGPINKSAINKAVSGTVSISTSSGTRSTGVSVGATYVVTSLSAVLEDSENFEIFVRDNEGAVNRAEIVNKDVRNDLAILYVPSGLHTPVEWVDSTTATAGDSVFAIGFNQIQFGESIVSGTVSHVDKTFSIISSDGEGETPVKTIQTDAIADPEAPQGPVFDRNGRLLGMNVSSTGAEGTSRIFGNAIPSNTVKIFVDSNFDEKEYSHGDLQVSTETKVVDGFEAGAEVTSIPEESSSFNSKLLEGDVVKEIQGRRVDTSKDLEAIGATYPSGEKVSLIVERDFENFEIEIVLG